MDKKQLFKTYTLKTDTVTIESWGGDIHIKELSAGAIDAMRKFEGAELKMAVTSIIHGVTHDDGKMVFTESDMKELLKMSVKDLMEVSGAVLKLSGLSE